MSYQCSCVSIELKVKFLFVFQSPRNDLAAAAQSFFASWLKLASTATGAPLEVSRMFSPLSLPRKSHAKAVAKIKAVTGESSTSGSIFREGNRVESKTVDLPFAVGSSKIIVGSDTEKSVVQMRVSTSFALGLMAASLPHSSYSMIIEALLTHLSSMSGVQRQVGMFIIGAAAFVRFSGNRVLILVKISVSGCIYGPDIVV